MSAKFKPTKAKQPLEATVDEWDASDAEEDVIVVPKPKVVTTSGAGDAWDTDLPSGEGGSSAQRKNGREAWIEANHDAPAPQPIVRDRTLPATAILAPRLTNDCTTVNGMGRMGEYDSRPPPQILRRDRKAEEAEAAAAAAAGANGAARPKTLAEREEEYRRARERIFGAASSAGVAGSGGTRTPPSRTGSEGGDSAGGNSPAHRNPDRSRRR